MQSERISYLLRQYLDNTITPSELDELMHFLAERKHADEIRMAFDEIIGEFSDMEDYQESEWDDLYQKIIQQDEPRRAVPFIRRWSMVAAAAVFLLLIAGAWLLFRPAEKRKEMAVATVAHDALPGGDRAVLTLADGATIQLDSAHEGIVGRQGTAELIKSQGAQLAYHTDKTIEAIADDQYNRLTTPRGGQYRLVLPDGSKVWLNAATTLRYPVHFSGSERVVEMSGEAYFEVAANPSMPFKVRVLRGSDTLQVAVLGTHFNINAYADEPSINTTLLEGSVRVSEGRHSVLVRPGEKAVYDEHGALKTATADTEEAIAWKEGLFRFNEATIQQVMRQLSRWYDVEVVYVNGAPADLFRGEMYRNVNASKILRVLEASGVHFTVEGNKILVKH